LQRLWPDNADIIWQTRQPLPPVARRPAPPQVWAQVDPLADPDQLAQMAQGRTVILCLAGVIPGRIPDGGGLDDNMRLAEVAVETAAAVGARVLLASSAAVYGSQSGQLTEASALQPANDYGRAKAQMEQASAAQAARLGVDLCALRIGNIAGLDAILGGWRPGFQLDRFADGRSPRRSYIGVQTLATVLAQLCAAPKLPAALNIATPESVEMGTLLDAAGLDWTAQPAPDHAIPEVRLNTHALTQITPLPSSTAADMVAQWRAVAPQMTQKETSE